MSAFSDIAAILEDIRNGKFVIVVDDEARENEGDLVIAAEKVTQKSVAFMSSNARTFLCLAICREIANRLDLPPMVQDNRSHYQTPFTVTIDARDGIKTGSSAGDRAKTIQTAVADDAQPDDLVRPGHIFPLAARPGGTLVRAGHTEAAVDLSRMAGLKPAGVIAEIMKPDGEMAKLPDLVYFAKEHDLKICSIADIIQYRHEKEWLVQKTVSVDLPTAYGAFKLHFYRSDVDKREHIAICLGNIGTDSPGPSPEVAEPVLVRVHDECFTGDVLRSLRCDCGEQLDEALKRIQKEGSGVVLYMRQEGRGIGLENKLHAYLLQQTEGLDTVEANVRLGFPADKREYGIGAQILRHLGVRKIKLLSNNPRKFKALDGYGLEIVERVPLVMVPNKENIGYLRTKKEKMGHLLDLDEPKDEEKS